jgi:hypothetical protein
MSLAGWAEMRRGLAHKCFAVVNLQSTITNLISGGARFYRFKE